MNKEAHSLRTPLGRVRGLGSAKEGVEHWWMQRVTAIALLVLSFYVVTTFFFSVVLGTYDDIVAWLQSPFSATFIIMFVVAGFYHAVLGVQVIIEDYIHSEGWKLFSILAVKFVAVTFGTLGVLSAVKVLYAGV